MAFIFYDIYPYPYTAISFWYNVHILSHILKHDYIDLQFFLDLKIIYFPETHCPIILTAPFKTVFT